MLVLAADVGAAPPLRVQQDGVEALCEFHSLDKIAELLAALVVG
jgi:hypothetical protein